MRFFLTLPKSLLVVFLDVSNVFDDSMSKSVVVLVVSLNVVTEFDVVKVSVVIVVEVSVLSLVNEVGDMKNSWGCH